MRRRRGASAVAAAGLVLGAPAAAELPATLEECYLTVATTRSAPESIGLARQLCDAAFGRSARPLAFLDPRSKTCSEWWFDRSGRYEDADRYCSLEADGEAQWKLACQWKSDGKVSFVRLREAGNAFQRVGSLHGRNVGEVFQSLAGCIEYKLEAGRP